MAKYEIGGLTVNMTPAAAKRWNDGILRSYDLRASMVHIPDQDREITLRRACSERLEPKIFDQICGMPANAIE